MPAAYHCCCSFCCLCPMSPPQPGSRKHKKMAWNFKVKLFLKTKGPICLIVLVKRQLNLSFQTWQGVTDFPERRRKGVVPYLLPPFQLTKDALKALVHVVELERSKWDCCVSLQTFTFLNLLLMETASIAWADYKNQIQKSLTGHKRLFLKTPEKQVGAGVRALTYGVKILTQRGFFSPRAYSKQKAMPSSSVSQRCISPHSKAITWFWATQRKTHSWS